MRSLSHLSCWVGVLAIAGAGCGDNLGGAGTVPSYTIGGTITGLAADGLILANNGGDNLSVASGSTSFGFATTVARGASYDVTVLAQPAGEICTVTGGAGTATADVFDVSVACTIDPNAVGQWTWRGGSDVATNFGLPGVYGVLGTPDVANLPGGREQAATWRDAAGKLWLFGGYGVDANGDGGQLDDLWSYEPTTKQWTWVSGTNVAPASTTGGAGGSSGVYGTLGTAAAGNVPGGREQVSSWVDASGAVWIFGGEGIDASGVTGELNDLWKFASGQWTWMGGSTSVGAPFLFGGPAGVYGTKGVAAPTNVPGGRYGAATWMDAQGNFWLFGGSGIDAAGFAGHLGYLSDLWKYTPGANGSIGAWTWVAGPDTVPAGSGVAGSYGTKGTAAAANYPGGRDAAMTWMDADGNVWIFGGIGIDSTGAFGFLNDLWKYTPSTGQWTWMSGLSAVDSNGTSAGVYGTLGTPGPTNVPTGRFSAASWLDSTGALWLLGGQGFDADGNFGALNDPWKFDRALGQWAWMGGSKLVGQNGGQAGVYGTLGVPDAANVPGGRFGVPTWIDTAGVLWMFGGMGYDSTGSMGHLNDLWSYRP